MLISHSHKFIFLHNPKVAGSSIREVLTPYVDQPNRNWKNRLLVKLGVKAPLPYTHHLKARLVRDSLPKDIYDRYFKFVFVRNPWDLQVSLYHYVLKNEGHHRHKIIKQMRSFDEYLAWKVENQDLRTQKDFVTDADGKIIVDFIGKYENLSEDFQTVCKVLKIDALLPHINQSKHKDYRQYYTDRTRQLVEEYLREDIEMFGYTFDGCSIPFNSCR